MDVDWDDPAIDPLDLLAEEFVDRYRRGERPLTSEYEDKYPRMASRIRHLFPALVELESVTLLAPPPRFRPPDSGRIGEYRIIRQVGAGGMGIVYEAVQESLGRRVALKVLPHLGMVVSPERFLREARIAARLHHTNIVPVFSVGEADGIHYYAMQFIDGPSLGQLFDAIRSTHDQCKPRPSLGSTTVDSSAFEPDRLTTSQAEPPEVDPVRGMSGQARDRQAFRDLAHLTARVAAALAYAHKQGVLHRDIKPSNLLLDSQGTPWLVDFGLAKSVDDGDLTATGDLLGTLRYLAPERFQGRADVRSDLYSLGATLYEMLTLRPAFGAAERLTLVEAIGRGRFPRPRAIDPVIPRDLETICLKAMAREPADRYPSAVDLAEDLKLFLADQPIRARRARVSERAVRWWRRDRAVATLTLAVGCLLLILAAGSGLFAVRTEQARAVAVKLGEQALQSERQRSRQLVRSLADRARAGRTSRRPGQRFESLDAIREAVPLARSLGELPAYFDDLRAQAIASMALPDIRYGRPGGWRIRSETTYRFDSRLRLFASAGLDGRVFVSRVDDGKTVATLEGNPGEQILRVGAGGLVVAARSSSGGLRVWDLRGPAPVLVMSRPSDVSSVDVRPDGEEIAFGMTDRTVSVVSLRALSTTRSWTLDQIPDHLAYSPDGLSLAVADTRSIAIRDLATGSTTMTFPREGPTFSMAWQPRGGELAAADLGGQIAVWDVRRKRLIQSCNGRSGGARIDFTPDGAMISSIAWDGLWRLHDVGGGKQRLVASLAGGQQFGLKDRLAAGPSNDQMGLAEIATGTECRTLLSSSQGEDPIESMAAHPGGRLLAVARNRWVGLWDLADGRLVGEIPISCHRLAFSSQGDLFTHGEQGLRRWPLTIGIDGSVVVGPSTMLTDLEPGGVMAVSTSADGKIVAATFATGLAVIDRDRPDRKSWLPPQTDVRTLSVSPDGRFVAAASWHGGQGVRVYETRSGRPVAQIAASEATAAFSPDGRWLVVGSVRSRQLWKVMDWSPGPIIVGVAHAFTHDGKLMATASTEGIVRLIQPETGRELAQLEPPDLERVYDLSFSADGARLTVSCAVADWIYTWDLRAIRRQLADLSLDWDAPALPEPEPGQLLTVRIANPTPDPLREWIVEEIQTLTGFWFGGSVTELYQRRTRSAIQRHLFDRALVQIDRDLALRPESAELHFKRGQILLRHRRDAATAAEAFEKAVAIDPVWREAQIGLALARIASGRSREALADLDQILIDRPWDITSHALRGRVLLDLGRTREAIDDLTAAVAENPSNLRFQRWMAEANDIQRTPVRAADKLTDDAANRLAWQLITGSLTTRDPQAALPLALQVVSSQPDVYLYHNTLGLTYYRLGRYREAITEFQESLRLGEGRLDAYDLYALALARHRSGDRLGGSRDFVRAGLWHLRHASTLSSREREELANFLIEAIDGLFWPCRK